MLGLGLASGLYRWSPAPLGSLAAPLAVAFVAPSLGEEVAFRGLLVPDLAESARPWAGLALATSLFVAWHIVEALVLLPNAKPIFLRPDFLACAAILGLGCGLIRWRGSSVWPAVALHWLVVCVWQAWLGGPSLEALR